jgi:hypothetical protein
MVIASIKDTATEIANAEIGPAIKPAITIIISFGSYLRNSTLEIGILASNVNTYAIALNMPSIASFFVLAFIGTSLLVIKKAP